MSIKNSFILLVFFVFVLSITSCESTSKRSDKVRSIGNTSEVLVVVQNEQQWENGIGKVIREYLGKEQYGLNQPEPIFKLAHLQKQSFNDLFQKHRNIIIVEIDPNATKSTIEFYEDHWSKPQRVYRIIAPSSADFDDIFVKSVETIQLSFNEAERERIMTVFRTTSPNKVTNQILSNFGLKMTIPKEYFVAKALDDFMWIRKEANEFSQGLIIFSVPYIDTAQFSTKSIVSRINVFQQQYIPGELEGTYMTTDDAYVQPKSELVSDFTEDYTIETRGLWTVEGDFMGGPFISYTFLDPTTNNIITMMGYVYQPNKDKRDLLRQVEAILYSTSLAS